MKLIEKNTTKDVCSPIFDFCLIDGAHTWETDGLAFFLITKILKSGGWLVLDDIYWTYAKSPTLKNKPFVQYLPDDQKTTPQLKGVFDLLIRQSPLYRDCAINSGIAICQKI
jgi:predicted O-methyltransferase YrrM